MNENKLSFLADTFSNYQVQYSDDFTKAILYNPFYNENIIVYYYEEDDFSPFCVCFSFDHCHLTDEEDVIFWINEVISEKKYSIEFFKTGQRRFGGSIDNESIATLTYAKLEKYTGYFGITKLHTLVDSFKIRGWNPVRNIDAEFLCNDNGSISIKKH